MVNKVVLIGNLGRDPEIRHLDSGAAVARFSIATNETYKDKNGEYQTITEWHDIIMWRGLAEAAEKVLTKGRLVYIEGKLTHRKYQDSNGVDKYITEVVANNFQVLDKRDNNISAPANNFPTEEPRNTNSSSSAPSDNPLADDDDLPF